MMNQPFTRERFSGGGGAARYRGPAGQRDLRVRHCAKLSEAILFTTSPRLMNRADRETFGRVEDAVRLSRYGGDCYAYCMLAAGHVDLVIETELKPYDVLPLVPIIAGAGGIITTWEGGAGNDRHEREHVVRLELRFDHQIDMARREHAIGVAVAAVARQPHHLLDPAKCLAIARIHQQGTRREQDGAGEIGTRAHK